MNGQSRHSLLSPQLLLLLLLTLVAAAPLLAPGYFWNAHDARHDVYFIFEYNQGVGDGDWLARWSPDFSWGYGYPMFLIYGPLPTFIGMLFYRFLGFGFTLSVEMVYLLAMLASGIGMYGFARSWLGRNAALIAAVAYVFIPYRLLEVYVRASLAEYVAMAWLPFILWSVRSAFESSRPGDGRSLVWPTVGIALSYCGLMLTSNLVALIFTPLLGLYALLLLLNRINEEQPLRKLSKESLLPFIANLIRISAAPAIGIFLGLLMSAFFWMPALSESQYVNQDQWYGGYYAPEQHFVYPHQLFQPGWGFGISQPGPDDLQQGGLSFQLGVVPVVLAIIGIAGLRRMPPAQRREMRFFWGWLLLVIFLMLPVSLWAWRNLGFVSYAQFPWRWLMLTAAPLAILAGSVARSGFDLLPSRSRAEEQDRNSRLNLPTVLLVLLVILGSYPYLQTRTSDPTPQQGPVSYAALMRFQQSSDRMTGAPKWVDLSQREMWSDMAELYVQADDPPLGPDATREAQEAAIARQAAAVTSKIDYRQMPQNETLAVWSLDMGSAHEKLWVHVGAADQKLVFNIAWFPGWRAYLLESEDGPVIDELPLEREDGPLARIVVPVPEGEHYVLVRFDDTTIRTVSKRISLLGWFLFGLLVFGRLLFGIWRRI
ncbi:MAG: hypothetical protein U9R25_09490 [Chloroflexota bacterium]|nr:hypothetical protein [Chloroflexota bacterium]